MTSERRSLRSTRGDTESGFTLLEVLVAFAVLMVALMSMIGLRTGSLEKSTQGRNVRVATTLARQLLAEVRAGQHDVWAVQGDERMFEEYEHFSYRILLGNGQIAQAQERALQEQNDAQNTERSGRELDRFKWMNDRRRAREDRAAGLAPGDSSIESAELISEPDSIDEETFEEVAVVIRYPAPSSPSGWAELMLRTRASTLALSGQLPEDSASSTATPTPIPEGNR